MTMLEDACWEAWRSGRNPDAVDADRMDDDRARGYEPDECVSREVHRIPSYHE
jgi:hypothetical protein